MIKKIVLLLLLPVSVNAHDSTLSHFQGGVIAEFFHTVSQMHHAYGGLAFVLIGLCAYKFYQLYKARTTREKREARIRIK